MLPKLIHCVLGAWLLAASAVAGAQALPPEVAAALQHAGVPQDHVAMVVAPVAAGPAGAHNLSWRDNVAMSPASVMKVVTTYAGLELLGPAYFWKTRVEVRGPVVDGVLHGDLVIRGSGDPKLVWDRLAPLFDAAQSKGLRRVRGDIVLDRGIFTLPPHDPGAFDGEALRPYNVGPDGLLLNFKALTFKFVPQPGTGVARVETEPPIAGVRIPTQVPTVAGACGDWQARLQANFRQPDQVLFGGGFPARCGEREWSIAYIDPDGYAPRVVRALWEQTGGELDGTVRWADPATFARTASALTPWVTGYSLPLAEIIADVNQYSNNVMAQQVFLTLSAQHGQPGSFAASIRTIDRWWRKTLAGQPTPVLDNGSGLSRDGRITAGALTALLRHAANGPYAMEFERSLPIAGVNGTARFLARRSPDSDAIGRARFKTGTLRDVVAAAGYVTGLSGAGYVVVGLINDPNAGAARPALDRLMEWAVHDTTDIAALRSAAK